MDRVLTIAGGIVLGFLGCVVVARVLIGWEGDRQQRVAAEIAARAMAHEELDRRDVERKRLDAEAREQRIRGMTEEILADRQREEQREQRVAQLTERILEARLRGEELPPDPPPAEASLPELNDLLGSAKRK